MLDGFYRTQWNVPARVLSQQPLRDRLEGGPFDGEAHEICPNESCFPQVPLSQRDRCKEAKEVGKGDLGT